MGAKKPLAKDVNPNPDLRKVQGREGVREVEEVSVNTVVRRLDAKDVNPNRVRRGVIGRRGRVDLDLDLGGVVLQEVRGMGVVIPRLMGLTSLMGFTVRNIN
jgi:hypothetical protein